MYERRHERLLTRAEFAFRIVRHALLATGVVIVALAAGVLGYRVTETMPWIDALLNASMILGGMGPVTTLNTTGGKLFASFYAIFSGLVFIGVMGIMLGPFVHRLFHRFHWDVPDD